MNDALHKDAAARLLILAEGDLSSAKHLLTLYPHRVEVICHLCARSAEKMLMAFLAFEGVSVPKPQELTSLCQHCAEHGEDILKLIQEDCIRLTPYSSHDIPPAGVEITEEDMQLALRGAEHLMGFLGLQMSLKQAQPDCGMKMQ